MSLSQRAQELLPGPVLLAEDRVVPHGVGTNDGYNYDLALHSVPGNRYGVLVVKVVLQFNFLDREDLAWSEYGTDLTMNRISYGPDKAVRAMTHRLACFAYNQATGQRWSRRQANGSRRATSAYKQWYRSTAGRAAARAQAQNWSGQEKRRFLYRWRTLIQRYWELKFKIRKERGSSALREIDVVYDVRTTWDETWNDHYQINAVNAGEALRSDDEQEGLGPRSAVSRTLGQAYIDNRDIFRRSDNDQIGCVHEYGHMQGLPDEYANGSTWRTRDQDSVMNVGMNVRPRHYTPLADWVSRKMTDYWDTHSSVATESHYYVDGGDGRKWTIANAGIYEDASVERGTRWTWEE